MPASHGTVLDLSPTLLPIWLPTNYLLEAQVMAYTLSFHVGGQNGVPGAWLWPGPEALCWGLLGKMKNIFLHLSLSVYTFWKIKIKFSKVYIYLKVIVTENVKQRLREKNLSSTAPFLGGHKSGLGRWKYETGGACWLPPWVAEAQALGLLPAAFPKPKIGSRIRGGAASTWTGGYMRCQLYPLCHNHSSPK